MLQINVVTRELVPAMLNPMVQRVRLKLGEVFKHIFNQLMDIDSDDCIRILNTDISFRDREMFVRIITGICPRLDMKLN